MAVLLHILDLIWRGLDEGLNMLWATLWALTLGFLLSGAVQSFVSKSEMRGLLGDRRPLSLLRATGFGAASSSCSYAASAMAKSLFAKGADFVAAMVFMIASTNLVIELGVVLAVLIGWQFTASEFFGGLLMIGLFVLVARFTIPDSLVERARNRLAASGDDVDVGAVCLVAGNGASGTTPEVPWAERLRDRSRWSDAAGYATADLTMLRKEMAIGFLAAGFLAALVPNSVWQVLFVSGHGFWSSLENAALGPLIAMLSFVCSVGNVPLAAALWKGGISFGGVISFIFADLITLPLLLIYRRFYGTRLTLRILASFWLVMSAAGLITQYLFSAIGAVPTTRPLQIAQGAFGFNYTTALDFVALVALAVTFAEARRRRHRASDRFAIDPVCGMQIERATAPATLGEGGATVFFCSDRCLNRFASGHPELRRPPAVDRPETKDAVAIDPVCGMTVDTTNPNALSQTTDGSTWFFCCQGCADKFMREGNSRSNSGLPTGAGSR
ncbi:MAG: permease [Candidatus Dormibacteria bacterium]